MSIAITVDSSISVGTGVRACESRNLRSLRGQTVAWEARHSGRGEAVGGHRQGRMSLDVKMGMESSGLSVPRSPGAAPPTMCLDRDRVNTLPGRALKGGKYMDTDPAQHHLVWPCS